MKTVFMIIFFAVFGYVGAKAAYWTESNGYVEYVSEPASAPGMRAYQRALPRTVSECFTEANDAAHEAGYASAEDLVNYLSTELETPEGETVVADYGIPAGRAWVWYKDETGACRRVNEEISQDIVAKHGSIRTLVDPTDPLTGTTAGLVVSTGETPYTILYISEVNTVGTPSAEAGTARRATGPIRFCRPLTYAFSTRST